MRWPTDDWQFYVVTLVFLGSALLLTRPFWARDGESGCNGCPPVSAKAGAAKPNSTEKRDVS